MLAKLARMPQRSMDNRHASHDMLMQHYFMLPSSHAEEVQADRLCTLLLMLLRQGL